MLRCKHLPLRRVPLPRLRRLLARERGMTLLEVLIALVILGIGGSSLIGVLTSATAANKVARERTLAQLAAQNQIESIRALDYGEAGLVGGNPSGCIGSAGGTTDCPRASYPPATETVTKNGVTMTIDTKTGFVTTDTNPLGYTNPASKWVKVTITRTSDSKQLAQDVTYIAIGKCAPTTATINATVVDYDPSGGPVPKTAVSLSTGPSAPENDTTDPSGLVTFACIQPGAYDLSVSPPAGFVTLYDTVSPDPDAHHTLNPADTWPTSLYIFRPATLYVQLKNFDGTTFTGNATVKVSYTRNSTQYSQTFPYTGSPLTINSMLEGTHTVALIPGIQYTVSATGTGFYEADPTTGAPQPTLPATTVPDDYPNVLTHTSVVTNAPQVIAAVTVKNSRTPTPALCTNATVTITVGPWNISGTTLSAKTNPSGVASIAGIPVGAGYTIKATTTGGLTKTLTSQPIDAAHTTFTAQVSGTGSTC